MPFFLPRSFRVALRDGDGIIAGVISAVCTTSLETIIKAPDLPLCIPYNLQSTELLQGKIDCKDWRIRSWFVNMVFVRLGIQLICGAARYFLKQNYLELCEIILTLRVNFHLNYY